MSFPRLERRPELDALRGIFLVWMTFVHMPTRASNLVDSPFGYISSAAGFILISALLVGRLYIHDVMRDPPGVHVRLWKRSLKVYGYHVLMLTFAFTLAAAYAVQTHKAALADLLHFYLIHPVVAVIGSVLLIYCPPLLDILPMYVIFLFLTPMVLWAASKFTWRTVLIISGSVWLLAQFGVRNIVHNWIVHVTHLPIPLQQTGSFNLFAWQAMWIVGLWMGARSATRSGPLFETPAWLVAPAAAIALFFVGVRWSLFGPHLTQQALGILLDKWQIGPLRVLNIVAFVILLYWLRKYFVRAVSVEPFLTLGKASLRVFCTQLFFVFLALGLTYRVVGHDIPGPPPRLPDPTAAIMFAVTLPVLFLVAAHQVRSKRRAKQEKLAREQAAKAPPAAVARPAESEKLECSNQGEKIG